MDDAEAVAHEFWRRMNTNDWSFAAQLFGVPFSLDWPQSRERIVSAADFVALNAAYPAAGRWTFEVIRLVGDARTAVTETIVSDAKIAATAVTFFDVEGGRIRSIREFWPDPFPAAEWRRQWVQHLG